MTNIEKARASIEEAGTLLRSKSPESTMVERYLLLYEAWETVKGLPQPLQMGKGLYYVLSKASVPVKEHDLLVGRYDDHVPSEEESARLAELWKTDHMLFYIYLTHFHSFKCSLVCFRCNTSTAIRIN